ncbi:MULTISPECIES: hypothetical protein [Comamonas]|uniref:phage head spike fiber domain-containing protein n=1 Tax=Comamonas TaxID=283 RepID=UPI0001DA6E4B|nr:MULTISPECIES: hypothetical protein [Comamonas]EFI61349.1 hypothetical protein CTS44_12859 [Comamonas thiooxydans]TFF62675.1 hypothetical protein EIC84_00950 [Comamonas sp. A23]
MSVIADLPDIRPSLLLDFANSRRVHPLIQCTRASTATCYGPDGVLRTVASNVPRIDFDPLTGKCLGLLVEEARTNLLLNSVFAGAASGAPGTAPTNFPFSVANGSTEVIAGGLYTTLRLSTATAARHFLTQLNTPVEVGQYAFSLPCNFYVASSVGNFLGASAGTAVFTARYFVDGVEIASGTSVGTGKKTVSMLLDVTTAGTISMRFGVGVVVSTVGDVEFSLPQLEKGAFPTSPILTTTAAATRAADLLHIDYTLPTVGAIVASVAGLASANTANAYLWSAAPPVGSGADHAYCYLSSAPNRANWWVNKGGVGQSGGNIVGRPPSVGVSFDATARAAAIASGSLLTKDTIRPRDFPANLSQLRLGCNNVNSGFLGGCISRLAVYSGRITDAQLQRLTA